MLRAKVLAVAAAVLLVAAVGATAAAAASGPSQARIRAAIAQAKRSTALWATFNACTPSRAPAVVGIRGQMPALGFAAQLSVAIQVEFWDRATQRFVSVPDANARARLSLGSVTAGVQQGGKNFAFNAHAGLLRGTVTFRWKRNGRLLLALTRHTSGAHRNADQGMPRHYSAATCRVR
jgi:hypothetical protein